MTKIYSYTKAQTPYTTISALTPESEDEALRCTELCTIDGVTYLSVPDGVTLPEQPEEIILSLVTLTPELKEQIKAASPHVQLIAQRMEDKIREKYSLNDEQYFARIGVGAALGVYVFEPGEQEEMMAFGAHVESVREWGRSERQKLGL